ncbi:MAG: hypothetical protein DIU78_005590 [Pseudomonadota bacterium]|nr:MAG: hypothetical protein DIU78_07125 [Pseudomonadota bacterium]
MTLDEIIENALTRYEREYDRYLELSARVAEICRVEIVEGNAIRAQVTSRVKTAKSFEGKIRKLAKQDPRAVKSVDAVFASIRDLAGVRIATYDKELEGKVVAGIQARFLGPNGASLQPEKKDKRANDPSNFYRATHCDVFLRPEELVGAYSHLHDTPCEVQVCSLMAHVWNEIEHDIRYKHFSGELSPTEQELLVSLGHLSRAGDGVISRLLAATEARLKNRSGEFADVYDFVARTCQWFPGADFAIHAGPLFTELDLLGLRAPKDLEAVLGDTTDLEARARTELAKLDVSLKARGHTRPSLDPSSSDLLLVLLLPKLARKIVENHPPGRGIGGEPRIAWIATRYEEIRSSEATA